MKVKDLIMRLIYCDPDADIKCVTYEDESVDAKEFALNIRTIEDYEESIDFVLDNLNFVSKERKFESLREKVLVWGKEKDLLHKDIAEKQFLKFMEEVFEFRDEWTLYVDELNFNGCSFGGIDDNFYLCELSDKMILEMGDIFVTLIILCEQLNLDPVYCLSRAYEKIKDRKGKTINGVFIKEEDLKGDLK